ncbi:PREDICTED: uncharacterized protein LOC109237646 [Nicotiana attenuata]|uniref:uncharacterized protein LOC109237646 n=1 Tax=Nicotiana attenuata TaxID=49451 RepID=UPI00090595E4|nr:PREDICTED: uncharacterized protein LOC109237646 [Nicotiana attenuata]
MGEKKSLMKKKKKRKMKASPNSLKLAGQLVKYDPNFIRKDYDDLKICQNLGAIWGMQPINLLNRCKIPLVKLWDYYVPLGDHYSTRISVHTNCSIVKHLKDNLDDQQIEMFRRTCFGYFVDLPEFFIQNQLIHSLLLREVVSPKDNELWIKVNSTKLRFGLAEFCIITGLKCNGDPDKDYESVQSSRLMELYFPSMSKVSKKLLTDCFLKKMWKSDEDALKIAVLYFIHSFLFSITNDDLITKNDFLLVESGDFETFPWGKVVFNATLESMKDKVRSKREMYRYGGLPLAFQCWFYECCPYSRKNLAYRIGELVPRILNWQVKKKVTFKRLRKEFFVLSQDQLVFGNISPTNDEQTRLQLHDFVPVCEDKNEIHIESGVVAEVKTNAKKHSKNKPKSQSINNENPDPLPSNLNSSETELKLLRSEIKKVNDKVSSLENLMISSFEKVFKALGERDASKGNRKDDDHHDKNVSENNFGSEEVMEKNIGIEEVVKKNVDNEVSLEQTVDVMEGVVKDSIQDGKSSEGVGDDEAWIEDAEPEITAITQQFCDKNTANMGSLVDDSVQLGKNSCEEVGEDNSWSSDAEAQITAITQKYFNQNIEHGDLGVEKNIATMQEDRIVVDHDTPEMNPRERKPAGVMKSPFMNTFDSGGTIQVVENKPTKSKKPILTIKYPFQGNIDNPVDFKVLDGVYTEASNKLKKIFEFGVDDIGEKKWFFTFAYPGLPLCDSHIDVIFYYLRKKGKYGVDVPVRFTTTDCWFNCLISNLYKEFLEKNRDMNLITETDPIAEYILGYFLRCNVPWSTVDEVLFPINLSDKWHWILARLSFKDLRIYVYDSMSGARQNSAVRRSVERYSVLLPYFLHRIGFWDTKENPMGIPANDPFEIHVVDGLPTQDNTDCGVYVAAFAEYIIQGSSIPKAIDIDGIRNRYGILLWDYGVKKQRGHAASDDESTGRLKDQTKKDKKKKSKSHSVVDDKSLKDNKKKGKTHAVCDDKTLKDIKKNSKLHDVGDDETLKDIKKKAFAFSTDFANLAGVAKLLQEVL